MKIMSKAIVVSSVVLFLTSFGAMAGKKERMEITGCVCDENVFGAYDCTIGFNGAAPAILDDYHAHITTEQDGVLESDGLTPFFCKAQTDCQGIAFNDPGYTATCTGAPLPENACTDLLVDKFDFSIVAKVAADADEDHGNAKRVLKDNYPHCVVNPYGAL